MHAPARRDLKTDIRVGVKVGLLIAAACVLLATVGYIVGGRAAFLQRSGGVGWWTITGSYIVGGLLGGFVIGLLRPLRKSQFGSFLIGFVSSLPLFILLSALIVPRADWFPWGVFVMLMASLVIGGGIGAALQNETHGWS